MSLKVSKKHNLKESYDRIRSLLGEDIVGMDEVIRLLLASVFCNGHCLLVGVPGLAKTLLISSLAKLLDLEFSRIQFTPDLMPNDITGAEIIVEDKGTGERAFHFMKGPLFANVILADEINRTPPKTQAALIEAMEERQVSSLGKQFQLEAPFFVLATQNPIEQEGTYPLPAAQLDRFIFNIEVDYPNREDEVAIMRLTTQPRESALQPVLSGEDVLAISQEVQSLEAPGDIVAYATRIARLSRPDDEDAPELVKKYVKFGAGPRAAQGLVMGSKALALMRGKTRPTHADVRSLVAPVFRHRMILNFTAAADNIRVEDVLDNLVESIPAPDLPRAGEEKKRGFFASLFSRDN